MIFSQKDVDLDGNIILLNIDSFTQRPRIWISFEASSGREGSDKKYICEELRKYGENL